MQHTCAKTCQLMLRQVPCDPALCQLDVLLYMLQISCAIRHVMIELPAQSVLDLLCLLDMCSCACLTGSNNASRDSTRKPWVRSDLIWLLYCKEQSTPA